MTQSSNRHIQKLMNEIESLDQNDSSLEAKLNLIAQKIAEEQRKMKAAINGNVPNPENLVDPADAFACEGCQ